MRSELTALTRLQVWLALLIGVVGFGGMFATYSYITPTMTELAGFAAASCRSSSGIYGVGMVSGMLALRADRPSRRPARDHRDDGPHRHDAGALRLRRPRAGARPRLLGPASASSPRCWSRCSRPGSWTSPATASRSPRRSTTRRSTSPTPSARGSAASCWPRATATSGRAGSVPSSPSLGVGSRSSPSRWPSVGASLNPTDPAGSRILGVCVSRRCRAGCTRRWRSARRPSPVAACSRTATCRPAPWSRGSVVASSTRPSCAGWSRTPTRDALLRRHLVVAEDRHLVVEPGSDSRFGNHSCDPNLGWVDEYTLATMADVPAGHELVSDYAMSTADAEYVLRCHCPSYRCRQMSLATTGDPASPDRSLAGGCRMPSAHPRRRPHREPQCHGGVQRLLPATVVSPRSLTSSTRAPRRARRGAWSSGTRRRAGSLARRGATSRANGASRSGCRLVSGSLSTISPAGAGVSRAATSSR